MTDLRVYAKSQSVSRAADDTWVALRASRDGAPIFQPWLTALSIEGKIFQVKAGTITAPLTGDVLITDTAAEMCVDAATLRSVIPVRLNVVIESLGGTLPEVTAKSVGAVSSSGAAFVPMNLRIGGPGASATARVAGAGGVTVAAELATTTRRHFQSIIAAVGNFGSAYNVVFDAPPVLVGPASFYVQVGTVSTGSAYFGDFDFVDLATTDVA